MAGMRPDAEEAYKICPFCGAHNPPHLLECRQCETDLTGVRIMDSRAESGPEEEGTREEGLGEAESPRLVRICECGAQNPPQARKCAVCGEDISDILPTAVPAESDGCRTAYVLQAVGDVFSVILDEPDTVIGREACLCEYLENRLYVSRRHARLTISGGKVFLENLSTTNRTFLNNVPAGDEPAELHDGDEIGLGGLVIDGRRQEDAVYFVFHTAGNGPDDSVKEIGPEPDSGAEKEAGR